MELRRILAGVTARADDTALKLLRDDHAALTELLDAYEDLDDPIDRETLVARILLELTIHARIEEELFYPALRQAGVETALMDQADVEHAMTRVLMRELHGLTAGASHYDAKVAALGATVQRHMQEEERQTFDLARQASLDLAALGGQMDAYRAALRARYELDPEGEELRSYLSARTVLSASERRRTTGTGLNRMGRERRPPTAATHSQESARPRAVASNGERRQRPSSRRANRAIGNS